MSLPVCWFPFQTAKHHYDFTISNKSSTIVDFLLWLLLVFSKDNVYYLIRWGHKTLADGQCELLIKRVNRNDPVFHFTTLLTIILSMVMLTLSIVPMLLVLLTPFYRGKPFQLLGISTVGNTHKPLSPGVGYIGVVTLHPTMQSATLAPPPTPSVSIQQYVNTIDFTLRVQGLAGAHPWSHGILWLSLNMFSHQAPSTNQTLDSSTKRYNMYRTSS